ncbi:GIY-YIG nuclease family protein [Escherichia coli]|nr:GIY-YIG nuclease family protein [Escherichia coli]EHS3290279.1 GIY-YIG nuclease family protein [Escherichia coli]EHS3305912.1 GIY-YIG nuclease family protein [Escherichia coli]EHS3321069.1 GIY-YIG nuclease family protein [Escherichia coli]EHS3326327.1 GIY-YIG nuclease family protein [Escherichia coli]
MIRFSKDIPFKKSRSSAFSPYDYELKILEKCKSINLTFNGFFGDWKGSKTKIQLTCHDNHTRVITIDAFLYGSRSNCRECECLSKEKARKNVETAGVGKFHFIGFVGEFKRVASRVEVKYFDCGHERKCSYQDLVIDKRVECPICKGKVKLPLDEAIKRITDRLNGHKFLGFVDGEYTGVNTTKLIIECPEGHVYNPLYSNFVNKPERGCPCCVKYGFDGHRPAYFYIQEIDGVDYIKIGITHQTPKQRAWNQATKSKLNHRVIFQYKFERGEDARILENAIKSKYKKYMGAASKSLIPDGYTETLNKSMFDEIKDFVSRQINH